MCIDIWSDIVCPFCLIGKRHLELALEQFEHREAVEIVWHSFKLAPDAPAVSEESLVEHIASKYGASEAQAIRSQEDIARRAQAVGITFNWRVAKPGNTFDAHRLLHLAAEHGLADAAQQRFKTAYFSEGTAVGKQDELRRLALDAGLPVDEVDEVLAGDKYAQQVRADEQAAHELGISGVPFFLIEGKWVINGA